MYHKVDEVPTGTQCLDNYVLPEQFDAQLAALSRWGYTFITLEDWLEFRAGQRKLPPRPIAITFDDGYLSNHNIAWPILNRYSATATVFLVADLLGATSRWDNHATEERLLGPEEIRAMQSGGIRFGSHTCTHRSLVGLSSEEAFQELSHSRVKLEAVLGQPVATVAYPYNSNNHQVRALARRAGYRAAVLGKGRINALRTSPWALRRIAIDVRTTIEGLRRRLMRLRWSLGI
jgi:peptidoglycan/xylan/chitin deacetylase (PgdA/CDA1 family)